MIANLYDIFVCKGNTFCDKEPKILQISIPGIEVNLYIDIIGHLFHRNRHTMEGLNVLTDH